jgi:Bacterial Ig-like domain (group 2)
MSATHRHYLLISLTTSILSLTITGLGCGGTSTSSTTTTTITPPKTLTAIAITPSTMSVNIAAMEQFIATATYSDKSTANVSSTATWTSSTPGFATVNTSGNATAVATGSTTIIATLSGVRGAAALTVLPKFLTAIVITPNSVSLQIGATQQFTATGSYNDGSTANITSSVAWASSTPGVASVSAAGVATAVAAGSAAITAATSGVTGTGPVAVVPRLLTGVSISPTSALNLMMGATQQFTATGTYNYGPSGNITNSATWTSSTPTVATVNAAGLATAVGSGSTTIMASLGGFSAPAALTVETVTSLAVTPASPGVAVDTPQQFTAMATYSSGSSSNVTSSATWTSSAPAVAFVDSAGLAGGLLAGSSTITATLSGVSGTASLAVTGSGVKVPLFHFDAARTGLNPTEGILSPATVSTPSFGKLFSYTLDGYVYGQPLLVSNLTMADGTTHNVVFVATENDSVYAFDSDNYGTGAPLWKTPLLQSGESPLTNAPIAPVEGVTSTPAIDLTTNTIYVVSAQTSSTAGPTFRVNALDLITGAQKIAYGSPVTVNVSAPGANAGQLTTACIQRAALLVSGGYVYVGFGGCHDGWLLAYEEQNLAAAPATFNSSPILPGEGAYASAGGVWMGGGGPVADSSGNIYISTGNGPWDGLTAWSDSVLEFSPATSGNPLNMLSYFTPAIYEYMDCADADLAAGGVLLIPGANQVVAGGKIGELFLLNTGSLGGESTGDSGAAYSTFFEPDLNPPYQKTCTDVNNNQWTAEVNSYEIFGTAAYFNGAVYLGITPTGTLTPSAFVRRFPYDASSSTLGLGAYAEPNIFEGSYGYTLAISANGTSDGVVWLLDHGQPIQGSGVVTPTSASLIAYDSGLDTELYNSANNSADTAGYGIKFSAPMVANGKVYIATGHNYTTGTGELDVYGLQ